MVYKLQFRLDVSEIVNAFRLQSFNDFIDMLQLLEIVVDFLLQILFA